MKITNNQTILFAGNSGDGIQFIGRLFIDTSVQLGYYVNTLADFPSEIRSPKDTISGISGIQIHISNKEIYSPGDLCDILILMNAAALKKYLTKLKYKGIIIADKSGFTYNKLLSAGYDNGINPLNKIVEHKIYEIDFMLYLNKNLQHFNNKNKNKIKNIFILGFIYALYKYPINYTEKFLQKFINNQTLYNANIDALKYGYNFGQKDFSNLLSLKLKNTIISKKFITINGNDAIVLGLIAGSQKAKRQLFYSSYPITPASDIFHKLVMYKNLGIKTFQAEDEIAAISSAIGASYTGYIGVTATSGPGMSLKQEALGLAVILELPLVIINVQRAGPSTGLPTKTEQADLMQAIYGRHGECPIPVLSAHSPSHCFYMAYNAIKIAIEYMTPVILLSDAYLAHASESYKFPGLSKMPEIKIPKLTKNKELQKKYYPYHRDERGVRAWITPGMKGYEHIIGSLEKEHLTGKISSDPINHELMIKLRQNKINNLAKDFDQHSLKNIQPAKILLLGWGSTYGVIHEASIKLLLESYSICHIHIDYLYPFPMNFNKIISSFKKIIIPELNNGQLINLIKNKYIKNVYPINKIQGIPFTVNEIIHAVKEIALLKD